jgi:hypothetical protein
VKSLLPKRLTLAIVLALASLAACEPVQSRTVRVVLSLNGAGARPVHGLDLTVALPAGSGVAQEGSTRRISSHALALRAGAAAATLDGRFDPHATTPSIRLLLASREPMRDGEVAAVEVTVTSAVAPPRSRFEVASARVTGPGGGPVPGATAWVSAVETR